MIRRYRVKIIQHTMSPLSSLVGLLPFLLLILFIIWFFSIMLLVNLLLHTPLFSNFWLLKSLFSSPFGRELLSLSLKKICSHALIKVLWILVKGKLFLLSKYFNFYKEYTHLLVDAYDVDCRWNCLWLFELCISKSKKPRKLLFSFRWYSESFQERL